MPSPPETISAPGFARDQVGIDARGVEAGDEVAVDLGIGRTVETAPQEVIAIAAQELILAERADQGVIAEATHENVGTGTARQQVVAKAAIELVLQLAARHVVATDGPHQHVAGGAEARADDLDPGLPGIEVFGGDVAGRAVEPDQQAAILQRRQRIALVRSARRIVDLHLMPDEIAGHAEALLNDMAGEVPGQQEAILQPDRIDRRVGHLEVDAGVEPGLEREDVGGHPIVGAPDPYR